MPCHRLSSGSRSIIGCDACGTRPTRVVAAVGSGSHPLVSYLQLAARPLGANPGSAAQCFSSVVSFLISRFAFLPSFALFALHLQFLKRALASFAAHVAPATDPPLLQYALRLSAARARDDAPKLTHHA